MALLRPTGQLHGRHFGFRPCFRTVGWFGLWQLGGTGALGLTPSNMAGQLDHALLHVEAAASGCPAQRSLPVAPSRVKVTQTGLHKQLENRTPGHSVTETNPAAKPKLGLNAPNQDPLNDVR